MSSTCTPLCSSHRDASGHICPTVLIKLLRFISGAEDVLSHTFEGLPPVLQQAISVASLEASCQLRPKACDIARIARRIQIKWSIYRLEVDRGEFAEDLPNDCRTLRELLQSIMDIKERKPSTMSSADTLGWAHDNRFEGASFNNIAGNYTVNSSSSTFIFIKQESGVGVCSTIISLILAFIFFRLLS
ncbi:hypothetical protein AX14_002056 [Amanita brunnescens Koide BX004]|nr:hypothetical protein AX14_002056 [Amanita brunnescens Koide BX004]